MGSSFLRVNCHACAFDELRAPSSQHQNERFYLMELGIQGHGLYFPIVFQSISNGIEVFKNWPVPLGAQVIINATVSVDSFFLISAALFSYLYIAKKTSPRQSFIVVAFRYLRLTVCSKSTDQSLNFLDRPQ